MALKSKKTNAVQSGISIELLENPPADSRREKIFNIIRRGLQFVLVLICTLSALYSFTSMMGVVFNEIAAVLIISTLAACASAAFIFVKKLRFIFPVAFAVIAVAGAVLYRQVINGAMVVIDNCSDSIAASMNLSKTDHLIEWNNGLIFDTTVFICIAMALLCLFISFFIYRLASFIGVFICTFPLFEIGAAYGCIPNKIAFAFMLSGWAAMLTLNISSRVKTKVKNKEGGKRAGKKKYATKRNTGKFALSAVCIALVTFVIFISAQSVLTGMGYGRSEDMDDLRHNVKNTFSNIYDYVTGEDHDGSLKEGQLTKMGDLKIKQRHYFTVEMPNSAESVYFKGYVGSAYTGNSWQDIDYSKYQKLLDEMNELGAYPASLTGCFLSSSKYNYIYPSGDLSFSDFRRKKDYAYITYGAYTIGDFTPKNDTYMNTKNKDKYAYNAFLDTNTLYNVSETPLYQNSKFQSLFNQYKSMVKQQYTALPDNLPQSVLSVGQSFGGTLNSKVDAVRSYLAKAAQYSLYSKKLPTNADFVDYFLNEQKQGYSAHFATAAAVLLRAAGVPTRYVEGYLLSTDQINAGESVVTDNIKKIDVTDEYAHAWVEVFIDNYGWVPVEATPGFYSDQFSEQMKQQNKNDQNPAENEQKDSIIESDFDDLEVIPKNDNATDGEEDAIKHTGYLEGMEWLFALIAAAVAILLIILTFVIVRIIRIKRLDKSLKLGNAAVRMFALYKYFGRLLKFEKISAEHQISYSAFADEIKQKSKYITASDIDLLMNLFLEAGYSNAPVREGSYSDAKAIVQKYADTLYKQECVKDSKLRLFVIFFNKLRFKFIYGLK